MNLRCHIRAFDHRSRHPRQRTFCLAWHRMVHLLTPSLLMVLFVVTFALFLVSAAADRADERPGTGRVRAAHPCHGAAPLHLPRKCHTRGIAEQQQQHRTPKMHHPSNVSLAGENPRGRTAMFGKRKEPFSREQLQVTTDLPHFFGNVTWYLDGVS